MSQRPALTQNDQLRQEVHELRSELVKIKFDLQLAKGQLFLSEGRNRILMGKIRERTRLLHFLVDQCKLILKRRDLDGLVEGFTRSYHLLHRN